MEKLNKAAQKLVDYARRKAGEKECGIIEQTPSIDDLLDIVKDDIHDIASLKDKICEMLQVSYF